MADKPFRVLLDLTDLHIENFKYVWISVSPRELKTISDFKTALLNKINLEKKDIKLFVRDGLLLDDETIIVLREDDTVKVQYADQLQTFSGDDNNERKKSRKRAHSDCNISDIASSVKRSKIDIEFFDETNGNSNLEINSKKRKKHKKSQNLIEKIDIEVCDESNGNSNLEMNSKKKKKLKKSQNSTEEIEHSEILENNDNGVKKKKKDKKKSVLFETGVAESNLNQNFDSFFSLDAGISLSESNQNNTFSVSDSPSKVNHFQHQANSVIDRNELNADIDIEKVQVNNCPKKKRKRRKKRKQIQPSITDISHNTDDNVKFISFSENENEEIKRKHIIYSTESCKKDSEVINESGKDAECFSGETFVASKNTSKIMTNSPIDYPKVSTPFQAKVCNSPSWHVSLTQKNSVNLKNESVASKKDIVEEAPKETVSSHKVSQSNSMELPFEAHYEDLPNLNCMPVVGTHIAYKTLELDESYSPIISEYRQGIVRSVSPETEELNIELTKHLIKPGRIGKFENLKPDDIPMPEIKKYDVLKWSNVISPKQIS